MPPNQAVPAAFALAADDPVFTEGSIPPLLTEVSFGEPKKPKRKRPWCLIRRLLHHHDHKASSESLNTSEDLDASESSHPQIPTEPSVFRIAPEAVQSDVLSNRNKRLSWGSIRVLSFQSALGDSPSVTSGPPLALRGHSPIQTQDYSVDDYEEARQDERRSTADLALSRAAREDWLRHAGYSRHELRAASEETVRVKRRSLRNALPSWWEYLVDYQSAKTTRHKICKQLVPKQRTARVKETAKNANLTLEEKREQARQRILNATLEEDKKREQWRYGSTST